MTTRRLHVSSLPVEGGAVELEGPSIRHAVVLRLRPGDALVLFDGEGHEADAHIEQAGRDGVRCLAEPRRALQSRRTRLRLLLGVPKGSKLEDCVRMATELGVDEIVLLETERTVPRWSDDRAASRLLRLDRVAIEAATQCERANLPAIHGPAPIVDALSRVEPETFGVVFAARSTGRLASFSTLPPSVSAAIGPEGGFTDRELGTFAAAGFVSASLGDSILRVGTAVPAALALLRDRIDGFGQVR